MQSRYFAISDLFKAKYHEDMSLLGLLPLISSRMPPDIEEMIEMIKRLVVTGHAYEAERHVLFEVAKDPEYGSLSGNRQDMIDGARVEVAPYKRDAADFVLWKPSSEDLPGWDSPWGRDAQDGILNVPQ